MKANEALRSRILEALADGPKTAKEIASTLGYMDEVGVGSSLRGMERARMVKRSKMGPKYEPAKWRRA